MVTTFSVLDRMQYKALSTLFSLEKLSKMSKGSKSAGPSPSFEYVTIELNSAMLDVPSQSISFFLETHVSADCELCVLEPFPGMLSLLC